MSDVNNEGNTSTGVPETKAPTGFGISNEIKSNNIIPFGGGFNKGFLTSVVKELIGDKEKFLVLTFNFRDIEGNKSLRFSEFTIDANNKRYAGGAQNKAKTMSLYDEDMLLLNTRIKHIYECYVGKENFPKEGLGMGATSWDDFFTKVAVAFNTGAKDGKEIYLSDGKGILVWLKMIYDNRGNIRLPYRPNFIEKIDATNQLAPKTLIIDTRYDKVEQGEVSASSSAPGVIGKGSATDYAF